MLNSNYHKNHGVLKIAIMSIEVGSQFLTHAEEFLTANEMAQFNQIKYHRRQQEWFAARLVSKLLVLNRKDYKSLSRETSFVWAPLVEQYKFSDIDKISPKTIRTVEISKRESTPYGKPEIYLNGKYNPHFRLSISHAGGWALASISSFGAIGIDIEEHTSRDATFYDNFFTPWERDWVQKNIGVDFTIEKLYTLLWTLKESYYKTGLSSLRGICDLSLLEVRPSFSLGKASQQLQPLTSGFRMSDLKLSFSHFNPLSLPKSSFLMMPNFSLSLVAFGMSGSERELNLDTHTILSP